MDQRHHVSPETGKNQIYSERFHNQDLWPPNITQKHSLETLFETVWAGVMSLCIYVPCCCVDDCVYDASSPVEAKD